MLKAYYTFRKLKFCEVSLIFWLQEISWHRLDDLPASDDVISRGLSGVKLYMVAPFLL